MTYSGSPWRSRFLRGPKIGLELGARPDFAPLGDPELAAISLGIKTGCDSFFFLTECGRATSAGRVRLRGLGNWEGEFSKSDVLPGIQAPRELDTPQGRRAVIPRGGTSYYLYPRIRQDKSVREYVEYAEARDIDRRTLVQANAERLPSGRLLWWRQTRALVRSRWALPYNSGYAYEAVDNAVGAVLNGRLVGVEPAPGIDSDALGGILNSTFTTLMRLLEGVATGNEGAFDVGPPAARVMRVPDPRRMSGPALDEIRGALAEIRRAGVVPATPDASGRVPDLRRRLDLAVASGLGLSGGDGAILLDRLYASYARWRAAVEAVEDQMREHRRALARRGGARQESPARRAGRVVWDEMSPAVAPLLADLATAEFEVVDPLVPTGDAAQDQLFDNTVVLDGDRRPLDLKDVRRVRLASYLRRIGLEGPIPLPPNPALCERLLIEAESAQEEFAAEALRRAKAHVSDDLVVEVVAQVHRAWMGMSLANIRQSMASQSCDPSLFETRGMVPPLAHPDLPTTPRGSTGTSQS